MHVYQVDQRYTNDLTDLICDYEELSYVHPLIRWITGKNKALECVKNDLEKEIRKASQWVDHTEVKSKEDRDELVLVLHEAERLLGYHDDL